ncbi:MAG: hypothetical protein M1831_005377 [Alyxoria varia]|nr:MAG: hypothetical protein M1831_005377 [Alyxoria varia]
MNCPSRPDPEPLENDGWNQSPNPLALHKREDLNDRANLTQLRDHKIELERPQDNTSAVNIHPGSSGPPRRTHSPGTHSVSVDGNVQGSHDIPTRSDAPEDTGRRQRKPRFFSVGLLRRPLKDIWSFARRYASFVGPGFLVSVAYIDPGNYATDVAAGASYRFRLLVMILVSNIIAIFLQSLSIRLGSVTGLNLAENCRAHCPRWLNYVLYFFAEAAIIATDIAEACGILGATVMPHGLYLGSGIVQPRLKEFDINHNNVSEEIDDVDDTNDTSSPSKYRPTLSAIRSCMSMSILELGISLFTFALFVNSAILIVAGASLHGTPHAEDADLFSIYTLFSHSLAPFAGTVFALALLFSGISAGIVCTIAGQMVSEGQLGWKVRPWVRRLVTRSISIVPSIVVAGAVGRKGVDAALQGSQVALSVILPFVSAPLIWFTCRAHYMTVEACRMGNEGAVETQSTSTSLHLDPRHTASLSASTAIPEDPRADWENNRQKDELSGTAKPCADDPTSHQKSAPPLHSPPRAPGAEVSSPQRVATANGADGNGSPSAVEATSVNLRNSTIVSLFAVLFWLLIVVMNVALIVLQGLGEA